MVAGETDEAVRVAIVRSLITLAQDGRLSHICLTRPGALLSRFLNKLLATSPTMQSAIKSALPKVLDLTYKDHDWEVRIAWVDALAKLAHSRKFRNVFFEY